VGGVRRLPWRWRGELDRDALWAIDYTIGRASLEAGRIVLDLREVTHLDYAGVPELVARRRELRARGGELVVVVRNPYVANILKAAGGADLLVCRTPDEAVRRRRRGAPERFAPQAAIGTPAGGTSSCSPFEHRPCCAARPWTGRSQARRRGARAEALLVRRRPMIGSRQRPRRCPPREAVGHLPSGPAVLAAQHGPMLEGAREVSTRRGSYCCLRRKAFGRATATSATPSSGVRQTRQVRAPAP